MREQSDAVSRLDSPGKRQLSQRLLSISQPHNKTARLIGTGRQGIVRDQNRLGCFQLLDISITTGLVFRIFNLPVAK